MSQSGFTLLPALFGMLLAGAIVALLSVQLLTLARQSGAANRQMRALTLAHNGVEAGRLLLASSRVNDLLAGPDGLFSPLAPSRDPLPIEVSSTLSWPWPLDGGPDDGRPGALLDPFRSGADRSETFLLRFSNGPAEGQPDIDGRVLLRSLGIVTAQAAGTNHVALVEADLQKEIGLVLPSPITALGSLAVELIGNSPVSSLESSGAALVTLIEQDRAPELSVTGPDAASLTARSEIVYSPVPPPLKRLAQPGYWDHFLTALPGFTYEAKSGNAGLIRLTGPLPSQWRGVAVAVGDTQLSSDFQLDGLLIHIGPGRLELDGAIIRGGVCMARPTADALDEARLLISPWTVIEWDPDALEAALQHLPVSLVGWRLLHPGTSE